MTKHLWKVLRSVVLVERSRMEGKTPFVVAVSSPNLEFYQAAVNRGWLRRVGDVDERVRYVATDAGAREVEASGWQDK